MPQVRTPTGDKLASPPTDRVIAALAARQHGLVTAKQLIRAGLSRNGIAARVRRRALHRVHRGVYAVGHAVLSRDAQFLAAVLAAGDGAALGGAAAAEHWRIRRRAEAIDVIAPGRRSVPGVRVHAVRTLRPLDVVVHRGVPITTVARTLVDLTDALIAEELANVIKEAAFRSRFSLAATRQAIERANGRRNLDVLEAALRLYLSGSAGTRSGLEVTAVKALKASSLPDPVVNAKLLGFEVDLQWPEHRLVVELDGPGHARPPNRRADAHRDQTLRAAGWTVLRFQDVERMIDELGRHLPCQSS